MKRLAPALCFCLLSLPAQAQSDRTQQPAPTEGRKITVRSSAYCLPGLTSRGSRTCYGTVAVDPRLIPLGSKLYVPGYGWAVAQDTGGSVRGNVIDIWFPSAAQCCQWGTRQVTITVVNY